MTGHGGPHSSNTKPLSTGQPTAVRDSHGRETQWERKHGDSPWLEGVDLWWPVLVSQCGCATTLGWLYQKTKTCFCLDLGINYFTLPEHHSAAPSFFYKYFMWYMDILHLLLCSFHISQLENGCVNCVKAWFQINYTLYSPRLSKKQSVLENKSKSPLFINYLEFNNNCCLIICIYRVPVLLQRAADWDNMFSWPLCVCVLLTTQRWAPPLQDDSSLSAPTGVRLQCVTQTLITVGPTGTEVVHAGSVPRLGWHHTMAGLKGGGLHDLTASVSPLFGLVACILTRVDVLARLTGWEGVAAVFYLNRQTVVWCMCHWGLTAYLFSFCFHLGVCFTLQLLPKSDSDWLSRPLGIRRSSW